MCYCVIAGFCHAVNEVFALLACYAVLIGSESLTFRDSLSVPSSWVKQSGRRVPNSWSLKMGPICCPETSVTNYHSTLQHPRRGKILHVLFISVVLYCSAEMFCLWCIQSCDPHICIVLCMGINILDKYLSVVEFSYCTFIQYRGTSLR
jgi:hypothetical protein